MDYRQIITVDPAKMGGKPCIRDQRITVYDVMEYLAGGMSIDEVLTEFPTLTRDDVRATFAYLADIDARIARAA